MSKPIPYDDNDAPESDERDMRKIAVYDDEALKMMQGWTGGQSDPLYAISSTGGWNYAWVFTDAIANIDRDLSRVKKLGRNKFQLGLGTFSKAEIDELRYIRDTLQEALDNPESELVDEARRVRAPRSSKFGSVMGNIEYTVEAGRQICLNGEPFISIGREGNTIPADADAAAHAIAEYLNQMKWVPPYAAKKGPRRY